MNRASCAAFGSASTTANTTAQTHTTVSTPHRSRRAACPNRAPPPKRQPAGQPPAPRHTHRAPSKRSGRAHCQILSSERATPARSCRSASPPAAPRRAIEHVAHQLHRLRLRLHRRAARRRRLRRLDALAQLVRDQHAVPKVDRVRRPVVGHQLPDRRARRRVEQQAVVDHVALVDVPLVLARVVRLAAAAARHAARLLDRWVEPRHQQRVVAQLVAHARLGHHHHSQKLHHRARRRVQLQLARPLRAQQHRRRRHPLRIHRPEQRAVLLRHKLPPRVLPQPRRERRLRSLQLRRAPVLLERRQLRKVVRRRQPDAHVVRPQVLQHDPSERRLLRVHQDPRRRRQPRRRRAEREVRRRHQHLPRVRLAAVKVQRCRLAHELGRRRHRQQRHLKHQQPEPAQARPPTLQVLHQRAEHVRRRHDVPLRLRVRAVAERVDRRRERRRRRPLRRDERPVVVDERAHVQHLVLRHAEALLDLRLHRHRVADVAPHRVVRHLCRAQHRRRLLERLVAEVDADHAQRVLRQLLAAQRLRLHVLVDRLQQRAVAAPHVRHDRRLLRHRLRVEDVVYVDRHHVVKVALVHEARADHVEHAVDVQLMPLLVVLEQLLRLAEDRHAQLLEHRVVRQRHAERRAALHEEPPRLGEHQPVGRRVVRAPLLRAEEAAHRPVRAGFLI
eukprot:2777355-Prymnesium_polylepis.2